MIFFQTSGAGSTFQFAFLSALGLGIGLVALWQGWQQARRDPREFDSFPLIVAALVALASWGGAPWFGWTLATGRFHEVEVVDGGAVVLRYALVGDVRLEPGQIADIRPELGHKNRVAAVFIRAGDDKRFYGRPIRTQRFDVERGDLLRLVAEKQAATAKKP